MSSQSIYSVFIVFSFLRPILYSVQLTFIYLADSFYPKWSTNEVHHMLFIIRAIFAVHDSKY